MSRALFIVAWLLLIVTPGQDMVLVMSRSIAQVRLREWSRLRASASGWSAGRLFGWLRVRPGVLSWLYRSSGAVLVALGLKLAFERQP